MNQLKLAESIFQSKAYPFTKLEKELLKRLPDNWVVIRLITKSEKKYKVEILLKRK